MKSPITTLVLLAAICGLLISTLHALTKTTIVENRQRYSTDQLRAVLGNASENIIQLDDSLYFSESNGKLTGFIFKQSTVQGYNGNISAWIAINPVQEIRGVRVYEHQETPGIGDKIDTRVSDWIGNFNGTTLAENNWLLTKDGGDFDHFTGATVTSRAMVNSVHTGLLTARNNSIEWTKLADRYHEQH
ncbi:MAG: RnfABCDGE type electron transport complex subunit G [Gammaproteobacteria bacterium]|nr:RnfABCDGE type electron transport complex subunit G [Gammaproteobacteria bacterium]